MNNLQATKLARLSIRIYGEDGLIGQHMYTNKYKNCRTVKCYWRNDVPIDIVASNIRLQIPGATVKLVDNSGWWGSLSSSLIVRIPLAEGDE